MTNEVPYGGGLLPQDTEARPAAPPCGSVGRTCDEDSFIFHWKYTPNNPYFRWTARLLGKGLRAEAVPVNFAAPMEGCGRTCYDPRATTTEPRKRGSKTEDRKSFGDSQIICG